MEEGKDEEDKIRNLGPTEPVFVNVYGAQESIPRHQFR
jgi:hypothetical protein